MKPQNQAVKIEPAKIDYQNSGEDSQKERTQYSLKSRILWLCATLVFAIILSIISLPGFFDNSILKSKIEQKAGQSLNSRLIISGRIDVSIFPYPSITADEVLLTDYRNDGKVYNLHSKKVVVNLSLISFLKKEFSINKISFVDTTIETYSELNSQDQRQNKFSEILLQFSQDLINKNSTNLQNSKITLDTKTSPEQSSIVDVKEVLNTISDSKKEDSGNANDFISNLLSVEKFQSLKFDINSVPNIEIKNGFLISYDKSSSKKEIENISGKISINAKKIRASGEFTNEKILTEFKLSINFNSENDSTLELNSDAMKLEAKGSFTEYNKNIFKSDFRGEIKGEIFELRTFYKDYISNNPAIYEKLKINSEAIKLSANVENKGGEITISDILIDSNLLYGKGSAFVDLNSDIVRLDINFDLDNLDLDEIWSKERVDSSKTSASFDISILKDASNETAEIFIAEKPSDEKTKLDIQIINNFKNFDLISEIKIKKVKYLSGEIRDLDLYLTISKEGQILILPIIFKIPGEGLVRLNGVLENSKNSAKFIGKIDVSGTNLGESLKWIGLQSENLRFDHLKNYLIYSDIFLFPNNIALNNFYLNLNNNSSELLGEIRVDSSAKVTNITNKFQVSTLNFDDLFLTSEKNIYLSSGSLLKNLLWLNEIPTTNDVSVTFDKLIYKGEEFSNNSSINLNFGQGFIKITNLNLHSENINLQANITADISKQPPEFSLDLATDNFYYHSVAAKNGNIADQFFAIPSLEGFEGHIAIASKDFRIDDTEIKNVKLAGQLKDGSISSTLDCDIYGGTMTYKGLIGIKNYKILNGNLTLKNIVLEELLPDLIGIKNVSGISNISANITSITNSKKDFLKSTNSEIKFNTSYPSITGYGLSDLVNKMFYINNYRQDLSNPEQIISNPESKTTFKQSKGTIIINQKKGSKFSINLTAPAINGIFSGKFNLASNSIEGLTNIIFVTGTKQKQIPLNIATAIKGEMRGKISSSHNLDQIKKYLGLTTANSVKTEAINPVDESLQSSPKAAIDPLVNDKNSDANSRLNKAMEEQEQNKVFDQLKSINVSQ